MKRTFYKGEDIFKNLPKDSFNPDTKRFYLKNYPSNYDLIFNNKVIPKKTNIFEYPSCSNPVIENLELKKNTDQKNNNPLIQFDEIVNKKNIIKLKKIENPLIGFNKKIYGTYKMNPMLDENPEAIIQGVNNLTELEYIERNFQTQEIPNQAVVDDVDSDYDYDDDSSTIFSGSSAKSYKSYKELSIDSDERYEEYLKQFKKEEIEGKELKDKTSFYEFKKSYKQKKDRSLLQTSNIEFDDNMSVISSESKIKCLMKKMKKMKKIVF